MNAARLKKYIERREELYRQFIESLSKPTSPGDYVTFDCPCPMPKKGIPVELSGGLLELLKEAKQS